MYSYSFGSLPNPSFIYLHNQCRAKQLFRENPEQVEKMIEQLGCKIKEDYSVTFDHTAARNFTIMQFLINAPPVHNY